MNALFANPWMLWGIAAVAAPIAIFLFTRFRYTKVEWAAIVFLQRALKKQQRRLRVENLLLLLIRCLVLVLLALALARPRAPQEVVLDEEDARKNVVLVLDTSYSMGLQIGSDTVFERARRAAKEVIGGLAAGDRVALLAVDEGARVVYPRPRQLNQRVKEEVLRDIDDVLDLQLSEQAGEFGAAFHALPRVLRAFDFDASGRPPPPGTAPSPKTVFLLTDAQRRGLLDGDGQLLDRNLGAKAEEIKALGGRIVLVDCGAEEPRNVSVVRLASREAVVGSGLPCHLEVTVKNWSALPAEDLTLEYYVDGAQTPQKTVSLSVPAEEVRTPEPLRYVFREPGAHTVEVRLKSDALTLDNRRHFVVDVRDAVRVLLVDGEPGRERWESETDFLYEVLALSPHPGDDGFGLLKPERVRENALLDRRLADYAVVVLANVPDFDDETVAALESYVRDGGAVVFTLGGRVDQQAYNDALWREGRGLFPLALAGVEGGTRAEAATDEDAPEWQMALGDPEGSFVSIFADEEMVAWLRMPSIFGFCTTREGGDDVRVRLRLAARATDDAPDAVREVDRAGAPLLVERAFGRGHVVAWLSSVDYAWNNCALYHGFYVPFWRELVLELAQRTQARRNLDLGERYERIYRADEYAAQIEVTSPSGHRESVVLQKLEGEDLYRLLYPDGDERSGLVESGAYTVVRRGPTASEAGGPERFAVRIDPTEGDLAKFTAEELAEALEFEVQAVRSEAVAEVLQGKGAAGGVREYWRELLAALVFLLALESVLAAAFGRRRGS
ncbi:MAG: VWA domain-containing protein [Planctomycetota bacterium]|nr:MAG: VWA domain-containing protein [Planctomycetota bacterium]